MSDIDFPKMDIRVCKIEELPEKPESRQSAYWALERTALAPFYRYSLFLATEAQTWAKIKPFNYAFSSGFDTGHQGVVSE